MAKTLYDDFENLLNEFGTGFRKSNHGNIQIWRSEQPYQDIDFTVEFHYNPDKNEIRVRLEKPEDEEFIGYSEEIGAVVVTEKYFSNEYILNTRTIESTKTWIFELIRKHLAPWTFENSYTLD